MLSYSGSFNAHLREELTASKTLLDFLCQTRTLPFQLRLNAVAIAQQAVLHNPSIYVINRKTLIVNKPHVFYNDDSSDVSCTPLLRNSLKWSKGFMGDCMKIKHMCKFEEPIQQIVLRMDHPKVVILEQNGFYYDSVPFPVFDSIDENLHERNYSFNSFLTDSLVTGKTAWCIKAMSCSKFPSYMDSDIPIHKCSDRIRWNCREEGVTWNDVVSQEWSFDDNLKVLMNNGEALSLYGITIAFNLNKFTQELVQEATYLVYRLLDNQQCVGDELKVDNIMRHHTGEIVLHRMRQGNLIFPLYPFDVDNGLVNNCPNVITFIVGMSWMKGWLGLGLRLLCFQMALLMAFLFKHWPCVAKHLDAIICA